jgi:hypothetical protein
MKFTALASLLIVAMIISNIPDAAAAKKQSGFMGHYGYLIGFPSEYKAEPSFQGPVEVVQFMPATPCASDQAACAKAGWINLSVFPKKIIKESTGFGSFVDYMGAVLKDSKTNGEAPRAKRSKLGALTSEVFFLKTPKGPFNRMAYLDGKKCYYRFAYDAGNKDVVKMMEGLSEVQPHDNPPTGP